MKTLNTGVEITYNINGSINTLTSEFDGQVTSKPLPIKEGIRTVSSYIPLEQPKYNNWINKHFR